MTPPIEGIEITDSKKAELVVSKLDGKEKEFLLEALQSENKQEKKESKETVTKSLEFEEDTFKIDSTGWDEEQMDIHPNGAIKVKVNATGDVVEYLEGSAKGEQIFLKPNAFIREVMKAKNCSKEDVEQKYLMTEDELKEKMKDKPSDSDEYKEFFNKEIKGHLAGVLGLHSDVFHDIGEQSGIYLAGGYVAYFKENRWDIFINNDTTGLSGRLLKN